MAYRLLLPSPGIEPAPPALEAWSLNHWTARKAPLSFFQERFYGVNRKKVTILFGFTLSDTMSSA